MSRWGQVKVLFSLSRHSNYSSYFYSILFFAADDRQNKNNPLFFFSLNALSGRKAPRAPTDPLRVYRRPVGRLELTMCRLAGRVVFNEAESSRNIRAHPQTISAAWNQSLGKQAATWHAPVNRTRSTSGQSDVAAPPHCDGV